MPRDGRQELTVGVSETVYAALVRAQSAPEDVEAISEDVRGRVSGNGLRQIAAQALQSAGDQVVNAKTVLPWLLSTLAAPSMFLALLVPVRESGSMLPQAALTTYLRRLRRRRYAWLLGATGQGLSALAMALVAATSTGWAAGAGILGALTVFALARALCSLASKDVLGRTIPAGQRGQINGAVTVLAGIVALTLGLVLRWQGAGLDTEVVAWLFATAAVCWLLAVAVYAGVREPEETPAADADPDNWLADAIRLLREDRTFVRFVVVRALLLVSALSPPFVVSLGVAQGSAGVSGLALFVLAQGVASLIGGGVFGRLADRSSRLLMVWSAVAASLLLVGFLLLHRTSAAESAWLYPATYLLLALVHLGARVARKTYVVDIAEGDQRTEYVAVSNAAMGILLLAVGGMTAVLATWGAEWALVLLAALGVVGAWLGRQLPEATTS